MSLSRSLTKSDSARTSDTPIVHIETHQDESGQANPTGQYGSTLADGKYDVTDYVDGMR